MHWVSVAPLPLKDRTVLESRSVLLVQKWFLACTCDGESLMFFMPDTSIVVDGPVLRQVVR